MIPGPFVEMVRGAEEVIAWRRTHAPECSRCGSADRLRYFAEWNDIFGCMAARALCYSCDDLGLTAGSRPRAERATSSLTAFYLWLLAAFLAGILVATLAIAALLSTSSRGANSGQTSEFESSAMRAWLMVEARSADEGMADQRDRAGSTSPSSIDPARITSATDETPAASAPSASPRSMVAPLRDDLSALVLAAIDAAAAEFGIDVDQLRALAFCESSLQAIPRVGRAQEVGWFQWLPSTWESNAPRLGYTILDIADPFAQARLTALVLREDGGWRWTCAK